jgi:DNA-binding GntR family transcriptional regulator
MVDEIVDNPARPAGAGPESTARRLADAGRPADRLREAIVTGRFQPSERLVEADVARQLGVGRSAVRTALARLEHEGLVEHERHRGARVRLVGAQEAVEILETRAVLEGLVARHAAARATARDVADLRSILEGMRRRLDAGDLLGASDQNAVLHGRILDISGHATAGRLIATLKSQLVRFQYRTILLPGRSERSFGEHSAIIDAIAGGDAAAAEQAMRGHLSHVAEALRGEVCEHQALDGDARGHQALHANAPEHDAVRLEAR